MSINIKNPDPKTINAVSRHLNDSIENSLQTPGGDITRDLYKWVQDNNNNNVNTVNNNNVNNIPGSYTSQSSRLNNTNINNNNTTIDNITNNGIANFNSNRKRSMSFSAISGNSEFLSNMILTPNSRTHSIDQSLTNVNNNNNNSNNTINDSNNGTNTNLNNSLIMTHEEIRAPGGFRRSFIIHKRKGKPLSHGEPNFLTRNFIEFLTLYPHFAGEDLSESENEQEDEEEEEENETGLDVHTRFGVSPEDLEEAIESETETSSLLPRDERSSYLKQRYITPMTTHAKSNFVKRTKKVSTHKTSTLKTILLLLKSFVGTGVLFLPRAFHNGGWGFSSLCLLFCAILSYYCFILLIITKDKIGVNGYGEMGLKLYGNKMKLFILQSIALSQVGFSAAYTVFTATNMKVVIDGLFNLTGGNANDSNGSNSLSLSFYIWLQALIFIPLALTRNIAKLSGTALVADLFILLGLIYVYYYSCYYVVTNGIQSQTMVWFNKSQWSLFIGTAIFTFEGIGLLIPIQESMKNPARFQSTLSGVMIVVTIVFISCGLICYSAFGSNVETVVLLNFPQDTYYTALVQLFYALAILLSTPLQMFPAIRILEHWTFPSSLSGKYNPRVKWLKNYFRTGVVIGTIAIAWVGANDLDKFVSLVGSLACIPLIYIHPPLLHFKASRQEEQNTNRIVLLLDLLICAFGIIIMFYTSWQTISLWLFS